MWSFPHWLQKSEQVPIFNQSCCPCKRCTTSGCGSSPNVYHTWHQAVYDMGWMATHPTNYASNVPWLQQRHCAAMSFFRSAMVSSGLHFTRIFRPMRSLQITCTVSQARFWLHGWHGPQTDSFRISRSQGGPRSWPNQLCRAKLLSVRLSKDANRLCRTSAKNSEVCDAPKNLEWF